MVYTSITDTRKLIKYIDIRSELYFRISIIPFGFKKNNTKPTYSKQEPVYSSILFIVLSQYLRYISNSNTKHITFYFKFNKKKKKMINITRMKC